MIPVEELVTLLVGLAGGGGLGAVGNAWFQRRTDAARLEVDADESVAKIAVELLKDLRSEISDVKNDARESLDRWHECERHRVTLEAANARHDLELSSLRAEIETLRQQVAARE